MDIQHLIDRLEELFNESRAIPLTHNVVIDEDRILVAPENVRGYRTEKSVDPGDFGAQWAPPETQAE